MSVAERVLGAALSNNNDRVRRHAVDRFAPNPRDLTTCVWNDLLESAYPVIRAERDAFVADGALLPPIEDLILEDQGNDGVWRAGLLVSSGRPATELARQFPQTIDALRAVPGLWSGLFSVLEPGASLPEHAGPNAGVLRYHLGIDCGADAARQVGDITVPYCDGVGILFDDTEAHAAWNRGSTARVTLFLEIIRPVNGPSRWANALVQRLLGFDPRYRRAAGRADRWGNHPERVPPQGVN